MNSFKIFININIFLKKIDVLINTDKEKIPVYSKSIKIQTSTIFEDLENILKKTILEIENKFRISVNNVNLMIEYQNLKSINITIKENFENKILSKTGIEYLLQDLRQQIIENHPEKKFVHMIFKKCFVDGEEYNNIPIGKNCKTFVIEVCFIYLKKDLINKLEILLRSHQIEINKLICTNYAKSLLNTEIDDLHKASLAVINESNLNEVTIVSKKMTKLGFFEKLFHIFS